MSKYPWLDLAMAERGVREIPGRRDNARIVEYMLNSGVNYSLPQVFIDEVPWCSFFENWLMRQCGIEGTHSAAALSWLNWGIECDEQVGAVVIFDYGGGHGHVTNLYEIHQDGLFCIGGNQRDSVCLSFFSRARVAGYRLPEGW